MRVAAYILAADPAWIEASVSSYYDHIDELYVSYDRTNRAWTGTPIRAQECIDRVRAIDRDHKVRLLPGDYARLSHTPMENDSYQRQSVLAEAGVKADWVLQLDTDEVLPNAADFVRRLSEEVPTDAVGVDWPMRAVFKQLSPSWFLEVCSPWRRQISEYPGCAAVRGSSALDLCRYPKGRRWRYDIRSVSKERTSQRRYRADGVIPKHDAVIHFSWARTEADLRKKLESWSHSKDFDGINYLERVWKPASWKWPVLWDLHPIYRRLWPALRPVRFGTPITRGSSTDFAGTAVENATVTHNVS